MMNRLIRSWGNNPQICQNKRLRVFKMLFFLCLFNVDVFPFHSPVATDSPLNLVVYKNPGLICRRSRGSRDASVVDWTVEPGSLPLYFHGSASGVLKQSHTGRHCRRQHTRKRHRALFYPYQNLGAVIAENTDNGESRLTTERKGVQLSYNRLRWCDGLLIATRWGKNKKQKKQQKKRTEGLSFGALAFGRLMI